MSAWSAAVSRTPCLVGVEGELLQIQVSTDPRLLEELLDCLAGLPFPINPQIYHGVPTIIEFPAYERQLDRVRTALRNYGFDDAAISVNSMLQAISG